MDSSRRPPALDIPAQPQAARDAGGPMSPCISVCTLDERGLCRGCFRTMGEISGWLRMSVEERLLVLRHVDARRLAAAC
jgi:predicted Fe-S protein YdhL (DUF1289 family)